MSEKNKTKKNREAKDKRNSAKTLGTLQADNKDKISKFLLYVPAEEPYWLELANWTPLAESVLRSISQIRFESVETTMLEVQYKSGRKWSFVLRKDDEGNWPRSNGQTPSRQKSNSKGIRPLSETHRGIPKPLKRPTHIQGILAKR